MLKQPAAPWKFVLATSGLAGVAFGGVWFLGDGLVVRLFPYFLFSGVLAFGIAWTLLGGHNVFSSVERSAEPRWVLALVFTGHGLDQVWRAATVTLGSGDPVSNWLKPGLVHTSSMVEGGHPFRGRRIGEAALHGQKLAAALFQLARMDPLTRLPNQARALRVNQDREKYGTLAEIGVGQEVAGWFFRVGASSGTIAKTISAYDMKVSDAMVRSRDMWVANG